MKTYDLDHLSRLTRAEQKLLMPLPDEVLKGLQVLVRQSGRCGSLQTRDGLPCQKAPRFGWTVCSKHGERAPQTTAKAERLLAVARMPAIEWILDELDHAQDDTCDHCGFPDKSLKERRRLDSLAFRLLDRTGFGPHTKIDYTVSKGGDVPDVPLENWTIEERDALRALLVQVRQLKDQVRFRLASTAGRQVLEGTLVRRDSGETSPALPAPAQPDTE